ncbi:SEC-C metal-binding domain-containing protein [uncultured Desulfosarcina sp.]|uniref:SEC-C metal-binding domain-containing protein n=1 Tax=uncultured Desulfosarcina sp. TaxID=218289 RepID=UPI0029C7D8C9|nr:SEC-C metal-binding domain-containing protein [uncultured Desulfosarcina sp.]
MTIDHHITLDTMSEADLEPVLELLRGHDPDTVARNSGVSRTRLLQLRDGLLSRIEQERARVSDSPPEKIGRNAPCPCGSGKKYKHCCLNRHEPRHGSAGQAKPSATSAAQPAKNAEQEKLIAQIEQTFDRLRAGRYGKAIDRAATLLDRYPDEDRLHDILSTAKLHAGQFDQALDICEKRMAVAEIEKAFFIEHGRYRDSEIDTPALSYYYPPLTWLQKTWIALKAKAYNDQYPTREDAGIVKWVSALKTADDASRFPTDHTRGLDLRRKSLAEAIQRLKAVGPDVVPYLGPLAWIYSWSGLFVPEIL